MGEFATGPGTSSPGQLTVSNCPLGTLIRSGYDLIFAGAWWVTVIPGLVLIVLLVSVNVLGDALHDALNPRLKRR